MSKFSNPGCPAKNHSRAHCTWGLGKAPPQFAMASLEFFRALPDRCGAGIVAALNRLPPTMDRTGDSASGAQVQALGEVALQGGRLQPRSAKPDVAVGTQQV